MFKKSPNVGLLWKNDACWSVSASDHLLTVPQRELTYVMLPSGSAAAGDVAVSVSRGSSTSAFTGLPSHEIQQMPCRHLFGQGVCSQSTQWWHCTVGLYPHLLSLVSLLRRAVCSFQLIVHCQRLCLFSCCIFSPPAGKGRQLSITVRCLLVDMCNFLLLCQMQNDHVVWEYVGVLAQGWIFKALTSQERFSPRLCC